jgi:hypothetical protein
VRCGALYGRRIGHCARVSLKAQVDLEALLAPTASVPMLKVRVKESFFKKHMKSHGLWIRKRFMDRIY